MRFSTITLGALLLAATATPALAQDAAAPPPSLTVTGGATLVSDYRFRGFSQNGEKAAIQGTVTVTHESGLYVGTWASSIDFKNLDGAGNGLTTEVDLYGGYSKEVTPGLTLDVGLLYYLYPKKFTNKVATDFFEPYINLSTTLGPVSAKVGANYAWDQDALGGKSAVYFHTDLSTAIPKTPFTLTGHAGYAKSDSFLGGADGDVFDYSVGVSATWKALTFGVSYVNTDAPTAFGYKEAVGADGAAIFSIGAAF